MRCSSPVIEYFDFVDVPEWRLLAVVVKLGVWEGRGGTGGVDLLC
jgi:hypothetical protein